MVIVFVLRICVFNFAKIGTFEPIEFNANVNCICIAYLICVFHAGIHAPLWGTVVVRVKNLSKLHGRIDFIQCLHLGKWHCYTFMYCVFYLRF